ncbi:MAG: COX15/CtaA family protein [Actinobacteria bacterium]|nr:COX15/CtaA family protein [Actinomycetota bacterium]
MSPRGRFRGPVEPSRFLGFAVAAVVALGLVVASGAFVRLTGSGLGCDNWPRCGSTPFPAQDFHAIVEFGNRVVALGGILAALVAWLAARRVADLDRRVRRAALGAFAGTVAQIPLGGLTVILDLHPLAVMTHFLLALVVVALSVVVALEAWSHARGLGEPVAPRWLRLVAVVGVVACGAMVVTGAIATASGPHPGADEDVARLGLEISDTVYVHVRATAVFGIGFLLVGWQLLRVRRAVPGVLRLAGVLLAVLVAQMLVGEIQYRNALPWGLVLIHVTLAAAIWGLTVATTHALWRPPLALLSTSAQTAPSVGEPLRSS